MALAGAMGRALRLLLCLALMVAAAALADTKVGAPGRFHRGGPQLGTMSRPHGTRAAGAHVEVGEVGLGLLLACHGHFKA